jgi:hydroxymethylglutaryl-CoA synthase
MLMTINANGRQSPAVLAGIDDMSLYVPRTYLPMEALAEARGYELSKLRDGLGLQAMSFPDVHEDAATMAANAVLDLMEKNKLDPRQIGRIYLGTESALDGSKPMATYVLGMLTDYYAREYGPDCFLHCDVVDLTFACIGAVDALQNTLDWVKGDSARVGIVVSGDIAKYELGSGGEYTQGAGAVALLVRQNPRLLAIDGNWGVATRSVHDFFKPVRSFSKKQVVQEVLKLAGLPEDAADNILASLPKTLEVNGFLDSNEATITLHKETPMVDGPYSNQCYQQRIREALHSFVTSNRLPEHTAVTERWQRIAFHLPYAYQARRMFSEIFFEEAVKSGKWTEIAKEMTLQQPMPEAFDSFEAYEAEYANFLRAITKTHAYRRFVDQKIEKGERASSLIGNMYTSSIFLALMSLLESDMQEGNSMEGSAIGFFAYGSGSKSKVFEGIVQPQWRQVVQRWNLIPSLGERHALDYSTYEKLHRQTLASSVSSLNGEFYLHQVNSEPGNYTGARSYQWRFAKKTDPVTSVL